MTASPGCVFGPSAWFQHSFGVRASWFGERNWLSPWPTNSLSRGAAWLLVNSTHTHSCASPPSSAGKFCRGVSPGRVLMSNSQNAMLLFSSDMNQAGSGFVVRHRALWGPADLGGTHKVAPRAHITTCVCRDTDMSYIHAIHFSYLAWWWKQTSHCRSCNVACMFLLSRVISIRLFHRIWPSLLVRVHVHSFKCPMTRHWGA